MKRESAIFRMIGAIGPALLLAGLQVGCGPARQGIPIEGPMEVESPEIAEGERVFDYQCAPCHPGGQAGVGPAINNKPLPEFLLRYQVRHGIGKMPAFDESEISEAELDALIAYIVALREKN
jgi:mono/diheme cytochrome c family protein